MHKVSGIRAALAVQHVLDVAGFKRTSRYNGGETHGWSEPNHHRSDGFSLRPIPKENRIEWSITISGRPHFKYVENTYYIGDEEETSNDPINPDSICPRLQTLMEGLGLKVHSIQCVGHQTMWDDDVSYCFVTDHPEWLEAPDPSNRRRRLTSGPILMSAGIEETGKNNVKTTRKLPVYQLDDKIDYGWGNRNCLLPNSYGFTREGLEMMRADLNERIKYRPELENAVSFEGDILVLKDRFDHTIRPVGIKNHWGDEVKVYPWPYMNVSSDRKYKSECPVLVNGEMVTAPDFLTLDSQYEGRGPWSLDTQSATLKP